MSRLFLFFLGMVVTACNMQEDEKSKSESPENIFFDYVITAGEANPDVVCKLQYKSGGPGGEALLPDSSKVELDGELLTPDSNRFTGFYYEKITPLEAFKGKHTIIFTSPGKRIYREDFEFRPFSLETELPKQVKRQEFLIKLKDFPLEETALRLVMTDTSFGTSWINRKVKVRNAELRITEKMLSRLGNGPIGLELYFENERKIKQGTKKGGRLAINYSLKREFELID